jgi:HPt (histidine-containing phosphotransfer) domain-containing protein
VTSDATEPDQSETVLVVTEPELLESSLVEPETLEVETSDTNEPSQNEIIPELSEPEVIESQLSDVATDEIPDSQLDEPVISDLLTLGDTLEKFESEIDELQAVELPEYQLQESTVDNPVVIHLPEPEITEPEVKQTEDPQTDLKTFQAEIAEDDRDPAIEPQFIETILAIAGHDIKGINFLLGVIDSYLEDTPRLVQAIDKAIAVNDHAKILQALSSLRSSSDYVGALALSYQCRQLESAVKANYVVLIYACLSQVAIEAQRATDTLRIERRRYAL